MNGISTLSGLLMARLPGAAAAVTTSIGKSFHPNGLVQSQFSLSKKECVMSCALKSSVVLSVAAMLLASSSAAVAGEKCAKNSVTTVAS